MNGIVCEKQMIFKQLERLIDSWLYQISLSGSSGFHVFWIVTPRNTKTPDVSGKYIASIWKAEE
jgi:hypothetical protein